MLAFCGCGGAGCVDHSSGGFGSQERGAFGPYYKSDLGGFVGAWDREHAASLLFPCNFQPRPYGSYLVAGSVDSHLRIGTCRNRPLQMQISEV